MFQVSVFKVFLADSLRVYSTGHTALFPLYAVLALGGAYIVRLIRKPAVPV